MPAIPFAPPRRRGLGANVCDGIARETAEGRRAVSGALAGMFPARRLPPRLQTPNSWQKLALFGGVGAERPRRPRAGAWHRPKSPASTAWTFSLAISGGPPPKKCRLL